MDRRIPLTLGRARQGTSSGFVGHPPVAAVHIGCDRSWTQSTSTLPEHNSKAYLALIDTGAEATVIDQAVAREIGAPGVGSAKVHTMGKDPIVVEGADIQVVLPRVNVVFAERAAILHLESQQFHLILGRSFLRHCRLVVDGPSSSYELLWVE
jgi:predicted aspartyl protease